MNKSKTFKGNPNLKPQIEAFSRIFERISPDKREVAAGLIENAVFTRYILAQLQEKIFGEGVIAYDKEGSVKESPTVKSYSTMLNRYSGLIKELINLLPKEVQSEAKSDALAEFVSDLK